MKLDIELITQLICEVADEIIMPRFNKLADGDVMEKLPGDLVTIADIEAEKILAKRLIDILPGSLVVGEEAAHSNPKIVDDLNSDQPIWIIDPIDGTRNFTKGNSVFGSMVCLAHRGELLASWIHDPARSRTAVAELGSGATLSGKKLHAKPNITEFEHITVMLNPSHRHWLEKRAHDGLGPVPRMAQRHGSVAHDYISLASGEFHCAQYRRLHPWDHAPGILLFREAGGFDQMIASAERYHPKIYDQDCLLLTPNVDVWEQARAFLNPGSDTYHV